MDTLSGSSTLYLALERCCERVYKRKSSVLFRLGERALGMFVIFHGTVILDFGIAPSEDVADICGAGALVGLPATLSQGNYTMTATVVKDADLGFLSTQNLFDLLRSEPEVCKQILQIMSLKVSQVYELQKALAYRDHPHHTKHPTM